MTSLAPSVSAASLADKTSAVIAKPTATPTATPIAAETAAVDKAVRTDVAAALKNAGLSSALPSAAVSAFVAQLGKDAVDAAQSAKTGKAETAAVSKALTDDVDAALKSLGLGGTVRSPAVKGFVKELTADAVKAFDAAKAVSARGAKAEASAAKSAAAKPVAAASVAETAAVDKAVRTDVAAALKNAGLSSALPSAAVSAFVAQLGKDAVDAAQSAKTGKAETAAVSKALTDDVDAALKSLGLGGTVRSPAVKGFVKGLTADAVKAFDAAKAASDEAPAGTTVPPKSAPLPASAGQKVAGDVQGKVAGPATAAVKPIAALPLPDVSLPKATASVGEANGTSSAQASSRVNSSTSVAAKATGSTKGTDASTSTTATATTAGQSTSARTSQSVKASESASVGTADARTVVDAERERAEAVRRQAQADGAASALSSILSGSSGTADVLELTEKSLHVIASDRRSAPSNEATGAAMSAEHAAPTRAALSTGATNDNMVSAFHPALRAYRDDAAA